MSYQEYLTATGDKDIRSTWIDWKVFSGMDVKEAIKAAYDPEWGWQKICA